MSLDVSELRSAIADAWNSQYSVDELNRLLQRFEPMLCNPLDQSPPDPNVRKAMLEGKVAFDADFVSFGAQEFVIAWVRTIQFL